MAVSSLLAASFSPFSPPLTASSVFANQVPGWPRATPGACVACPCAPQHNAATRSVLSSKPGAESKSSFYFGSVWLSTHAPIISARPGFAARKRYARCWQQARCRPRGNTTSRTNRSAHLARLCAAPSGVVASYANGALRSEPRTSCRAFSGHRRGRCRRAASPSSEHGPDGARRF